MIDPTAELFDDMVALVGLTPADAEAVVGFLSAEGLVDWDDLKEYYDQEFNEDDVVELITEGDAPYDR